MMAGRSGHSGTLLRLSGGTWTVMPELSGSPHLYAVALSGSNFGWAVGPEGAIWQLKGETWQATRSSTRLYFHALALDEAGAGYAVGQDGAVAALQGERWTSLNGFLSTQLNDVALRGTAGWAVGKYGTTLQLRNGYWRSVSSPAADHLASVALSGPEDGWAVGVTSELGGSRGAMWRLMAGTWVTVPVSLPALVGADRRRSRCFRRRLGDGQQRYDPAPQRRHMEPSEQPSHFHDARDRPERGG